MAVTQQRIFRARDGRPVPEGHQDATALAYAPGDEVPDVVLEQFDAEIAAADQAEQPAEPDAKQARTPANKVAKPATNKADEV